MQLFFTSDKMSLSIIPAKHIESLMTVLCSYYFHMLSNFNQSECDTPDYRS